jgi:hypothetical protein
LRQSGPVSEFNGAQKGVGANPARPHEKEHCPESSRRLTTRKIDICSKYSRDKARNKNGGADERDDSLKALDIQPLSLSEYNLLARNESREALNCALGFVLDIACPLPEHV